VSPDPSASGALTVIVGLGNPGPEYAGHRHNLGAMVVDLLAQRYGERFRAGLRGLAELAPTRIAGHRTVLAKPRTYMYESGGAVRAVLAYYKVAVDHLVVVHDELDIPFETIRLKVGGGAGGHNGVRSVDAALGTREYARVRVGIGRPPGRMQAADFVLRDFAPAERKELPLLLERAADAVETLLTSGLEAAQSVFHSVG
jgi:PTH1 family peptidyl-tRNA hydrolase